MTRLPFLRTKRYFIVRAGFVLFYWAVLASVPFRQNVDFSLGTALVLLAAIGGVIAGLELRHAFVQFDDRGLVLAGGRRMNWKDLIETGTDASTLIFVFDSGGKRKSVRIPLAQFDTQSPALQALRAWAGPAANPHPEETE